MKRCEQTRAAYLTSNSFRAIKCELCVYASVRLCKLGCKLFRVIFIFHFIFHVFPWGMKKQEQFSVKKQTKQPT